MKKSGNIIEAAAGAVIFVIGLVLCFHNYVQKGNTAYFYKSYLLGVPQDLAKALAKIGAITTSVNAVIAVIVATIIYLALRPVMKKTGMLREL